MSLIVTSKAGNIDGPNTPAVATIEPCIGGLIVWYEQASALARETAWQQDDGDTLATAEKA